MTTVKQILIYTLVVMSIFSCTNKGKKNQSIKKKHINKRVTAKDILGNPNYLAISYGGYRKTSREYQPTIDELKEDMKILHAMNIKIIRTYNVQLPQASNILKAIRILKEEDPNFEMYVMLGAWIDCKNAWTDKPLDHNEESEHNSEEIKRAVALANAYPNIVKIIAVGNEAMVKWAESYYVQPLFILKWVKHLQNLKATGDLSQDLWITSSDDFASWGGGSPEYHTPELEELIKAVDYISMHTYPFHNTHYNPEFWGIDHNEAHFSKKEKIAQAMQRALNFAKKQYDSVSNYAHRIAPNKPVHIGETGWATLSNGHYGNNGSNAADEFKEALYYNYMRAWTNNNNVSCFYFEAFDEPWKDTNNPNGSENHFGLFTVNGRAKYALWESVDKGLFKGLTRNGNTITKTFDGNEAVLLKNVELPVYKNKIAVGF